MAIATEHVQNTYNSIQANVPIMVDIPTFAIDDVYVNYDNGLVAEYPTDYTVTLGDDFETFTVTPTEALLLKMEENTIDVGRLLNYETDATPPLVSRSDFTSNEFDRSVMRDQQLAFQTSRSLKVRNREQADLSGTDALLMFNSDGDVEAFSVGLPAQRANRVVGFSSAGVLTTLDLREIDANLVNVSEFVSYVETREDLRNYVGLSDLVFVGREDFLSDGTTNHVAIEDDGDQFIVASNGKLYFTPISIFPQLDFSAVVDELRPASELPNIVLLEKMRTDFAEFKVYTPIDNEGRFYTGQYFVNRFNRGNTGAPVIGSTFLATLSAITSVDKYEGGVDFPVPPVTIYTPAGSGIDVGSWTAEATVVGQPNVSYAFTDNATRTYNVNVPEGGSIVALGATVVSNGGVAAVVIRDSSGVEIPDAMYRCVTDGTNRIINYRDQQGTAGPIRVHLASEMPQGVYSVVLTSQGSINFQNRPYDAGLHVYGPVAFDITGSYGVGVSQNISGNLVTRYAFPGVTLVYRLDDVLSASPFLLQNTNGGQVTIKVFDGSGTLLSEFLEDTYGNTTLTRLVNAFEGGIENDYLVHIELLNTRNVNATNWDYMDMGVRGTLAAVGTPGQTPFDDLDFPSAVGNLSAIGTNNLYGPGNLMGAMEVRPVGSVPDDKFFTLGVHVNDGPFQGEGLLLSADIAMTVDGAVVDYGGAPAGTQFVGSEIEMTYTLPLMYPQTGVQYGTIRYILTFNREGFTPDLTMTYSEDTINHLTFINMTQSPGVQRGASNSLQGGAMEYLAFSSGDVVLQNQYNNLATVFGRASDTLVKHNGTEWAVISKLEGLEELRDQFDVVLNTGYGSSSIDFASASGKGYTNLFPDDVVNGRLIPAGTVIRYKKNYRVVRGADVVSAIVALTDGV